MSRPPRVVERLIRTAALVALCAVASCRPDGGDAFEADAAGDARAALSDDTAVVGVVIEDDFSPVHVCTGVVIAPQVVLTGGTCVPPGLVIKGGSPTAVVVAATAGVSLTARVPAPVAVTRTVVDERSRIGLVGLRDPIDGVVPHKTRAARASDEGVDAIVKDHVQSGVSVFREEHPVTIAGVVARTLNVAGLDAVSEGAALYVDGGNDDGEVIAGLFDLDAALSCAPDAACRATSFDDLEASFIVPFVDAHGGVSCDAGDYCDPSCSPRDLDCVEPEVCTRNGACASEDDRCAAADPDCDDDADPPSCASNSVASVGAWSLLVFLCRASRSRSSRRS